MEFEFDENKSVTNQKKHGINFVQAQQLWDNPVVVIPTYRGNDPERQLVIGTIEGKH